MPTNRTLLTTFALLTLLALPGLAQAAKPHAAAPAGESALVDALDDVLWLSPTQVRKLARIEADYVALQAPLEKDLAKANRRLRKLKHPKRQARRGSARLRQTRILEDISAIQTQMKQNYYLAKQAALGQLRDGQQRTARKAVASVLAPMPSRF